MHYVYLIRSESHPDETYIGLTSDLRARIAKHNEGGYLTSEPNDTPEDPLHLAMCIDPEGNEFMMTQSRR